MQENILYSFLEKRKITRDIIDKFNIHWGFHSNMGECIVIPIYDNDGNFLFNKYRRNPIFDVKPKYIYDKGSKTALYCSHLIKDSDKVLITEGELDAVVAWSHNIPAVSSTGGALSFREEWAEYFVDKEVIICFDNDEAGAEGMVKTLKILPNAKVLFLPDRPDIKDISDYVSNNGNLHDLLSTAKEFKCLGDVIKDRGERLSLWKSVLFHDKYIKSIEDTQNYTNITPTKKSTDILTAKSYPITNLLKFIFNKAICPFHNENTPSLHYYRESNSCWCFGSCGRRYDSIDIYMKLYNVSFTEAVKKLSK